MWIISFTLIYECDFDSSKHYAEHDHVFVETLHLYDEIQRILRIHSDSLSTMHIERVGGSHVS